MPEKAADAKGLGGFGEGQTNPWKTNLLRIKEYGEITLCTESAGTAGCWRLQSPSRGAYGYSCERNELHSKNCSGPADSQGCCQRQSSELYVTHPLPEHYGWFGMDKGSGRVSSSAHSTTNPEFKLLCPGGV